MLALIAFTALEQSNKAIWPIDLAIRAVYFQYLGHARLSAAAKDTHGSEDGSFGSTNIFERLRLGRFNYFKTNTRKRKKASDRHLLKHRS